METSLVYSIGLFFLLISSSRGHTHGTVTVDTITFDRILQNFKPVLVKFDDKYPHGEKHENFKRFAASAANTKELLIAEVPVATSGEKENEELAEKYNVKKEDFPVYKLFLKDKPKPFDYHGSGDKTEDDLRRFLTHYTGIWVGMPGTLEELDYLARDFFDASSANDKKGQQTLLAKAREEAGKLVDKKDQKNAESYLKIMEAIAKQGLEFLKREGSRIQKLLKEKITNEKREELQHRANILLSFKSTKESMMYQINDMNFNGAQQNVKIPPTADKDL